MPCKKTIALSSAIFSVFALYTSAEALVAENRSLGDHVWRSFDKKSASGCVLRERFGAPRLLKGICKAKVDLQNDCDGLAARNLDYLAVPLNAKSDCTGLVAARDFFPESIYRHDEHTVSVVKNIVSLLRKEAALPSDDFLQLGNDAVEELRASQMSALVDVQIDPSDDTDVPRYQAVFSLPNKKTRVVLTLGEDGSNPVWARLLE